MIANILQTNTRNTEKRERIHCKFPGYVHDTLVLIQPFLFFTHAPFLISERKTKSKKFSYIDILREIITLSSMTRSELKNEGLQGTTKGIQ